MVKLDEDQSKRHEALMSMPTNEWPNALQQFVAEHDASEDEYSPLVAERVKMGGMIEDPLADETDADAERGRVEALMSLGGHPKMSPEDLKKLDTRDPRLQVLEQFP